MHLDATGMCKLGNCYNLVLWVYGPVERVFQSNHFSRRTDERLSPSKYLVNGRLAQHMNVIRDDDVVLHVRKSDVML
jgi:hypothetical protein